MSFGSVAFVGSSETRTPLLFELDVLSLPTPSSPSSLDHRSSLSSALLLLFLPTLSSPSSILLVRAFSSSPYKHAAVKIKTTIVQASSSSSQTNAGSSSLKEGWNKINSQKKDTAKKDLPKSPSAKKYTPNKAASLTKLSSPTPPSGGKPKSKSTSSPVERPLWSPNPSASSATPSSSPPALSWLELYAAKKNANLNSSSTPPPIPKPAQPTSTTATPSPSPPFPFPSPRRSKPSYTTKTSQSNPNPTSSSSSPSSNKLPLDPRGNVPPSVLEAGNNLHKEILTSWIATQPSAERIAKRNDLLAFLGKLVGDLGPQYSVVPFGSVAVGADGNTSDLDLAIRDADHPEGFDDPQLFKVRRAPYDMYHLHNLLRRSMSDVQAIPWARVPVVKFVDPKSGIDVDINCNNLGGVNNSTWLLSYLQLAPHTLRPLIHAVKKWASMRKINDPAGQEGGTSFSSYTIQLLCLAYLQAPIHLVPAALSSSESTPSTSALQSLLPNLQSPSLLAHLNIPTTHLHLRDKPPTIHKINTTYAPLSSLPPSEVGMWTKRNESIDVGELIKGFFRFYAGQTGEGWGGNRFDWKEGAVSPLEGGFARRLRPDAEGVERVTGSGLGGLWIRRKDEGEEQKSGVDWCLSKEKDKERAKASEQLSKWNNAQLVIRDPFEWHKNCGQTINQATSQRILREFSRAHTILSTNPEASFFRDVCAELNEKEASKTAAEKSAWR